MIKNDLTMVIGGGGHSPSAKTFYYNNYHWLDGPKLNQARALHGVGIVTDETTQEKLVTVTGGWYNAPMKSTEILIDDAWSIGEKRWTYIIWSCVEKLPF